MESNNKNKLKQLLQNNYIRYGALLLIGVFIGWFVFEGGSAPHSHELETVEGEDGKEKAIWTCSMHPQIRQDKPGLCPLCAMELTPLIGSGGGDGEDIDPSAIVLSKQAIALANIQTTIVSRKKPVKSVSLYGTIQMDERLSKSQTSHVNGRIEQLNVNFTGETVSKGQTIATIYSPELLNAQRELLEAKKLSDTHPVLLDAARQKLRLWKLSDEQIAAVENSGNVSPQIAIKANTSGVVVEKLVNEGDYVSQGSIMYKIANLSQVWAMFDAYEVDLPFLAVGDKLDFTLQAIPGKRFTGRISFIDPILNKTTRTAKVRVVSANPGLQMKPEMYAMAEIEAPLNKMKTEQIVVPKSAVLWTGKRSVVYVKQPNIETPAFIMREVDLGASLGDGYVILGGLSDGEEIATNGVFTIDASAQLEAKPSMMNKNATVHDPHATHNAQSAKNEHDGHDAHSALKAGEEHTSIKEVQGACDMCKETIEKTALTMPGVTMAHWDNEAKELHINYNSKKSSIDAISKKIASVGYDIGSKYKADDKVYEALPPCCHYRDID